MTFIDQLEGSDLETAGKVILHKLGFTCIGELNQAKLKDLFPNAGYGDGDHLEFDFLIPDKSRCYVGEITARTGDKQIKKKYNKMADYIHHFNHIELKRDIWKTLGVPEDKLKLFSNVMTLYPFMMINKLESFDLNLANPSTPVFYRSDLKRLQDYAESIGKYGKGVFLQAFPHNQNLGKEPLLLKKDEHNLIISKGKTIVSGGQESLANIFTFEVSPYKLMKFSTVYRNDSLPDFSKADHAYQRPLVPAKLKAIREELLCDSTFMFPNGILAVLGSKCTFNSQKEELTIVDSNSSVTIIDGQHRLYSYADSNLEDELQDDDVQILVTAIKFETESEEEIVKCSARAFVEINSNQTSIDQTHIDSIAYDILGHTTPRAIAAKVLLGVNERKGPFHGLFRASYTAYGAIQPRTVLAALVTLMNLERIQKDSNASENSKAGTRYNGYKNLLGFKKIDDLTTTELVKKATIMTSKYGCLLKKTFPKDWPNRKGTLKSSLGYSKMMSALMKLLRLFMEEGLDFAQVEEELGKIKSNVQNLTGASESEVCFQLDHEAIPKAEAKQSEMLAFLIDNR